MGAYRSGFAYVVLSPLSLDFYYTNTGIQTNWGDDRRFMVGMRVFLVGHVRSTQWSWIKSSMSNRSSKSRQAPPSPLGCIRKSAGHLLWPLSNAGNNWCRTSVGHGCWPCDQYSVPIVLKLHFGSCPCLEGSPFSGRQGQQADTEAHPQRGLLPK